MISLEKSEPQTHSEKHSFHFAWTSTACLIGGVKDAALALIGPEGLRVIASRSGSVADVSMHDPLFDKVTHLRAFWISRDTSQSSEIHRSEWMKTSGDPSFLGVFPVLWEQGRPKAALLMIDFKPHEIPPDRIEALHMLISAFDAHTRLERENTLLDQSAKRLTLAMEGAKGGLWDWNVKTNEVFLSKRWKALLGYSNNEIAPTLDAWRKLIHPEDLGRALRAVQDYFNGRLKDYEVEYRLKTKSGSYRWFFSKGACIRDTHGLPIRMAGWIEDMTEKKEQQERLWHAEKMASLGAMAGGIAHEINNPITIINGSAEQLRSYAKSGKLDQALLLDVSTMIESTVDRIAKIVKGLRVFSKDGEHDPFVLVSIKTLVDETLVFCRSRFRHESVKLCVEVLPHDMFLECRPVPISQVLINLLNNALDAVQCLSTKWVSIQVSEIDDDILISVTDSGNGIPEDIRAKLMQPFFTTKSIGKGTGLGLCLSKNIVESHGGCFFLDTDCPNTRFILRLPKRQPAQPTSSSKDTK